MNSNGPFHIQASARYVLEDSEVTLEDAWNVITRPFSERYRSWHPSYADFEPIAFNIEGQPKEFEVVGTSGGRYPWKIEEWNESDKILKLWRGPSKNPPNSIQNAFLGINFEFQIHPGAKTTLIDIFYQERWTKMPWPTEEICFKNGPHREIHWIFNRFPLKGKIDYIRIVDNKREV